MSSGVALAPLPRRLASLVRIEHTVFALPFAYVGALLSVDGWPGLANMVWVTLAMVGARTLAMSLNRLVDAEIDARNPRTSMRELPSGDRIVHYEVTVRDRTPAESVNVVWVEPNAGWESVVAGDEVVVAGRVRRRFFQIAGRTTSRTEVVAERVVPARQARRVRALLDRALAAIDAADE